MILRDFYFLKFVMLDFIEASNLQLLEHLLRGFIIPLRVVMMILH